jgi:hypothetical protein
MEAAAKTASMEAAKPAARCCTIDLENDSEQSCDYEHEKSAHLDLHLDDCGPKSGSARGFSALRPNPDFRGRSCACSLSGIHAAHNVEKGVGWPLGKSQPCDPALGGKEGTNRVTC